MNNLVFNAIHFSDLRFEKEEFLPGYSISRARVTYPNGYGASIVGGYIVYGDGVDTFELAVMQVQGDDIELIYDTPITNNVLPYLSKQEIEDILVQIRAL